MTIQRITLFLCVGFASLSAMGQQDISFTRHISQTTFEKGDEILVTLNFNNNSFKKNLRLIELLPSGSSVQDIKAPKASIDLVNEHKLILNWKNIPSNSKTEVSYTLKAVEMQEENIRLNGAIYHSGQLIFQSKESVLNPSKPVRLRPSK